MSIAQTAYGVGDDALGNQFLMTISPISYIQDTFGTNVRIITVDIPEVSVGTYTIEYKTRTIEKVGGKITTPTQFSFTFRIDKNWDLYKGFISWHSAIANQGSGVIQADASGTSVGASLIRTSIEIQTVDHNDEPTGMNWDFEGCWPVNVSGVGFDQASGDPLTATITMSFLRMIPTTSIEEA